MPLAACQRRRLFVEANGLLRISERPPNSRADCQRADCWVMAQIDIPVVPVAVLVIERHASVDLAARIHEATAEPSCWPCGVVRLKRDFGVMKLVRNAAEIARNLVRTIQPATRNVEVP